MITPRVQSMASPAWIMITLSMKPNPTMGMAHWMAYTLFCLKVGVGMFAFDTKYKESEYNYIYE